MRKPRWSIEQKKQHITRWRASELTRRQYCELNNIPFHSFREWSRDIASAAPPASETTLLPVHIRSSSAADPANEPLTVFLPGGIRLCCHPSQLADVVRALKYADA